jgi:hypothetical protein
MKHPREGAAQPSVDLANRLALRAKEAAECLGVSESTLRRLTPVLPHVREGGVLLFPVRGLTLWLEERAKAGESAVNRAVREILDSLE